MGDIRLASLNKVIVSGKLVKDANFRYTHRGVAVVTFPIAIEKKYKTKSGEWRDDVCFIDIIAWDKLAENCGNYLHKGSGVLIEGRLQSRNFETEDGYHRTIVEIRAYSIQFLDNIYKTNNKTYNIPIIFSEYSEEEE